MHLKTKYSQFLQNSLIDTLSQNQRPLRPMPFTIFMKSFCRRTLS